MTFVPVVPSGPPGADPQAVVDAFLAALAAPDLDLARSLMDDDILYVNVGMPPVRGAARVERVLRGLDRPGVGFEVYLHNESADGGVVLNERTDVIRVGRWRWQFWVCGRFEVSDGRIVVWRDAFDYVDLARGALRGLLGAAWPRLAPQPPASPEVDPGR
jgi:limonene-1,2-epoxide hydrolase